MHPDLEADSVTDNAPAAVPATRTVQPYVSPRLAVLGGIQELTSAVGTMSAADGGMGMTARSQ